MKTENSVYEITPPSLMLVGDGLAIFILGNPIDIDKLQKIIERQQYQTELYFFKHTDGIQEDTIAWAKAAIYESDIVIIDLDTANNFELSLALLVDKPVYCLARSSSSKELAKLLSGYDIVHIADLKDLENELQQLSTK